MEQERSKERGKITEITENPQRKKRGQRNSHTEGSQRKADGKFKSAQTLKRNTENYWERGEEGRESLGGMGTWERGCGKPREGVTEGKSLERET